TLEQCFYGGRRRTGQTTRGRYAKASFSPATDCKCARDDAEQSSLSERRVVLVYRGHIYSSVFVVGQTICKRCQSLVPGDVRAIPAEAAFDSLNCSGYCC